jgi:thioredoxin reductase (NADPH)
VENYPGSIKGETGNTLIDRMSEQVTQFGADKIYDEIVHVNIEGKEKVLKGKNGEYIGKAVIIASGASSKLIGCPGESEFTGKGVSYCATCDGPLFENLDVYVMGGGDAAVEEAIFLTKFAKKVTVIHRRNELRAAKSIQEKAMLNPKISFMWDSVIKEIKGKGLVNSMIVENVKTGETTEIKADEDDFTFGIFVYIGYEPKTEIFKNILSLKNGYVVTDENMKTNIDGVFAVGDIRIKSLRQVVTAVSDGAIAAIQAEKYLNI